MRRNLERWIDEAPRIECDWDSLKATYRRSLVDLAALRFSPPIAGGRSLPAAGLPWFMTMFGRDSIFTSLQALPFTPELAATTLRALGDWQGVRLDDFRDEDPGRILHEMRYGEMTAFEERPHSPVLRRRSTRRRSTSCCSTSTSAGRATERSSASSRSRRGRRSTGSTSTPTSRAPGYIWYQRRNEETGLENQCWKDSWDSISFRDGTLPGFPRATCELQGYAYDAKVRGARLAREIWKDRELADQLEKRRRRPQAPLQPRLLGRGRRVLRARARPATATRSTRSRRTTATCSGAASSTSRRRRRSPGISSARGSSPAGAYARWPRARGATTRSATTSARSGRSTTRSSPGACGGTASRTRRRRSPRASSTPPSSSTAGCPRRSAATSAQQTKYPVQYPTACSPQAWSTGTPLLLLRTMLGLEPQGEHLVVDPALPSDDRPPRAARHPRPLGSHRRVRPRPRRRVARKRRSASRNSLPSYRARRARRRSPA